jgi:hypothetical protein
MLDIISGFAIAGIGLAFLLSSLSITDMLGERLPPWALPLSLSVCTIIAGLVLSFKSWRTVHTDIEVEWPDRSGFLHLLAFVGLTIGYLLCIELVGMPLATAGFITATVWQLNRRIVQALIIAVITAVIVHYVFGVGLDMNFPAGIFGR